MLAFLSPREAHSSRLEFQSAVAATAAGDTAQECADNRQTLISQRAWIVLIGANSDGATRRKKTPTSPAESAIIRARVLINSESTRVSRLYDNFFFPRTYVSYIIRTLSTKVSRAHMKGQHKHIVPAPESESERASDATAAPEPNFCIYLVLLSASQCLRTKHTTLTERDNKKNKEWHYPAGQGRRALGSARRPRSTDGTYLCWSRAAGVGGGRGGGVARPPAPRAATRAARSGASRRPLCPLIHARLDGKSLFFCRVCFFLRLRKRVSASAPAGCLPDGRTAKNCCWPKRTQAAARRRVTRCCGEGGEPTRSSPHQTFAFGSPPSHAAAQRPLAAACCHCCWMANAEVLTRWFQPVAPIQWVLFARAWVLLL